VTPYADLIRIALQLLVVALTYVTLSVNGTDNVVPHKMFFKSVPARVINIVRKRIRGHCIAGLHGMTSG
jgi:hypothetical protein